MICWMFPGQPTAFADVLSNDDEFREIALLCQKTTGFNPLENGSSPDLSLSVRLQLYGVCISLFRSNVLMRRGDGAELIAEHSMGIYPALAASGSIDGATALELTWRIGECMAKMGMQREYALGCVTGLTRGPLEAVAANNGVHMAAHNTSHHFLLAGEREKIDAALVEASASGAFSVSVLCCDAPLHTELMEEIAGDLHRIVAEYRFGEPRTPLVEHIAQTVLTSATIPPFLIDELCHPVNWEATYRALRSRGVTRCYEVGAGSALAKFNRWIDSDT